MNVGISGPFPEAGESDTLTGFPLASQEISTGLFGPYTVGWNIFFMVMGIMIGQVTTYLQSEHFKTDKRWRQLVAFCTVLFTFAYAIVMAENNFFWGTLQARSTTNLETYRPWDAVGPILGGIVALLVQCFFAQRCYSLLESRKSRAAFCVAVSLGILTSFAGALSLAGLSLLSWYGDISNLHFTVQQAQAWWLWTAAITDAINTATLAILLQRQMGKIFKSSDSVLFKLIWLNIRTGSMTAVFATIAAILSVCFRPVTDLNADFCGAFYFPLPALYAVSLFTNLNARENLAREFNQSGKSLNLSASEHSNVMHGEAGLSIFDLRSHSRTEAEAKSLSRAKSYN